MATTISMSTTPIIGSSNDVVATASGFIALLQEQDPALKSHALMKLLECVDTLWHEVAESLPDLETISEDFDLPLSMRQRAAAVASRVFFFILRNHHKRSVWPLKLGKNILTYKTELRT